MTDESSNKNSDKINPQKRSSLAEDAKQGQAEIIADGEQVTTQATDHPKKPALSKREIMEALSRERFPWEE